MEWLVDILLDKGVLFLILGIVIFYLYKEYKGEKKIKEETEDRLRKALEENTKIQKEFIEYEREESKKNTETLLKMTYALDSVLSAMKEVKSKL